MQKPQLEMYVLVHIDFRACKYREGRYNMTEEDIKKLAVEDVEDLSTYQVNPWTGEEDQPEQGNPHAQAVDCVVVVVDKDDHDKEVRRIACASCVEAEHAARVYNDVVANWWD